jgi:cytochrome bd-type quinol oxidase subunit 2
MFKKATLRDLTVFVMGTGLIFLLIAITLGDYYVALQEERPVDESVVSLLSMAVTGVVGIVAGYVSGKSTAKPDGQGDA